MEVMGKNDDLREWNDALDYGQRTLNDMRRGAIRQRGWHRRLSMRLIRFMERWMECGKRWRDQDVFDD
jgi:hypothetical protein